MENVSKKSGIRPWLPFLIFPFFNPTGLKYISGLKILYDGIQTWKLCACIIIWIIYLRRNRVSKFWFLCFSFQVALIITSLINGVYDSKIITNMLIATSLVMMTEICACSCFNEYINQLWRIDAALVFVDFLLAIVFPKGLRFATLYKSTTNPLFFLGIDNALASQLIPFVFLATLRWAMNVKDKGQKNDLKLAGSYVIALATLMIAGSATGIFVVAVFIILSIQFTFIKRGRIPYKLAIGVYAFFFIDIIVLQSNNFIVGFISGLLGRSATFTGRSLLWRMAIDEILKKPFLGYGYTAGNINVWGGMFSSHNMFLEILLQGGLFSFGLFIAITLSSIKRNIKSPIWLSNTVFLAIFCMLLKGLMEASIPTFYYVIITIAYDAPYLVKQYNERREDIVST